jgi:hypothetical protein
MTEGRNLDIGKTVKFKDQDWVIVRSVDKKFNDFTAHNPQTIGLKLSYAGYNITKDVCIYENKTRSVFIRQGKFYFLNKFLYGTNMLINGVNKRSMTKDQ